VFRVQPLWKQFLEQRGFAVTKALDVDRAVAPALDVDTSATRCVDLNHLTSMQLIGPDAMTFLQGYLTCDLTTLEPTRALPGAYCNIKGRVVADATVLLTQGHPTLVIHGSLREAVTSSLRKYLAFSRSKFAPDESAPILLGIVNPRDPALQSAPLTVSPFRGGWAIALPGSTRRALLLLPPDAATAMWLEFEARSETTDAALWDLLDVRAGIAHICAATSEIFLPQMLDYDQLGAVSFTKGCYLGQEIVARTQHLGRPKRHLHALTWHGSPTPVIGEALNNADGSRAGTLVNAASTAREAGEALAVLNDAIEGPLHAGTVEFSFRSPTGNQ
jgi:folate-binding protein YgfZ